MSDIRTKTIRRGVVCITGNYRENNEDSFLIEQDGHVFVVADGMGGMSAGEIASEMAVQLVSQKLGELIDFDSSPPEQVAAAIEEAVRYANLEIMSAGQLNPDLHSMGTTIALVVIVGHAAYIAGVGDSRVYSMRGQTFEQLTKDHSVSQALLESGAISKEEAATHPFRNHLSQFLGGEDREFELETRQCPLDSGDRFILCSDGVTDGVDDDTLATELHEIDDPQRAAQTIVRAAQSGRSRDNITCIVVHVI
jgi:serine/threonine protein phosphatase PrpC